MPKTATERLTDTQRARLRNGDPEEVFRESSRQMRLVPLHSDKASMPRHLLEHRRHVVVSGSSLTGDLTTWSGVSDESLSKRFVPARVARLYTAGNAMRQCHQRIVDRRRRSGRGGGCLRRDDRRSDQDPGRAAREGGAEGVHEADRRGSHAAAAGTPPQLYQK